jgi:hypothetical protein
MLKQEALAVWALVQEAGEEQERQQIEAITVNAVHRILGAYEPQEINGPEVLIDGLLLRHQSNDNWMPGWFELRGKCPQCGQSVWSEPINSLTDLGKLLAQFEPAWNHTCPKPSRNTTADPLDLITDILKLIARYLTNTQQMQP